MPRTDPLDLLRDALRVKEYARLTGKSLSGAYADVQSGAVPSLRVGSSIRIPRDALAAAIARSVRGRIR